MKTIIFTITLLLFTAMMMTACSSNDNNAHNDSSTQRQSQSDNNNGDDAYKVVIDPGHGGKDKGAEGADNRYEKNFTLKLGKKVQNKLEKEPGIKTYMTRDDDTFISQESRYRPKYANKLNADIYLSIHGNTFNSPDVSGTETYYYHKEDQPLAEIMQDHVTEATDFRDRGTKKKELFVLKDTNMPSALIEVGYLTNPQDVKEMFTDGFEKDVAASIVEGIKAYRDQIDEENSATNTDLNHLNKRE